MSASCRSSVPRDGRSQRQNGPAHPREPARPEVREELVPARLERAIGVIYRPDTELRSHYFHAALP
jgi:hypothetical protein